MADRYLVVYPRGFIGTANAGLNKETNNTSMADKIEAIRYNQLSREADTEVYNLNITDMYRAMVNQHLNRDKLTVERAIVFEAYRNLGMDLVEFLQLQRDSRYFTRTHQEFILDTLLFIQRGKRNTSMRAWEISLRRQLINDSQSVSNHATYGKRVAEFFQSVAIDGNPMTGSMDRVITQWLSHRNGHEDLLLTLNILFGKEFNK